MTLDEPRNPVHAAMLERPDLSEPAMERPWKRAHDTLADYVTALVEDAPAEVRDAAFVTYRRALDAAEHFDRTADSA